MRIAREQLEKEKLLRRELNNDEKN